MTSQLLEHNQTGNLLQKYNTAGPRYTSYPTAPVWLDSYQHTQHEGVIRETNRSNPHPLSLYTHLPFCESRCLFCGCNVVITKQKDQAEKYLDYLFRELEMTAALMERNRPVVQFHWGGGTPTYLSEEQMIRLFQFQTKLFPLDAQAEVAIEVDPRVTTLSQLEVLKDLGFNRVSLGVQDFNSRVQETINRVQPLEMTAKMTEDCRRLGFEGLNFDLIYGLPHQSVESFEKTVREVIALNPDRLALYSYAHVPWLSPHQAQMPEEALPVSDEKFKILQTALHHLTEAGYRYIGMDHFAKPSDELSRALDTDNLQGSLHRNFMGYTVQHGQLPSDLYGFGVSAISGLQRHFAQNWRKLSQYYDAIDAGLLPTMRGYVLSDEDQLRQQVILSILCQGHVDYAAFETRFGIQFEVHFKDALLQLESFTQDGLIEFSNHGFIVTPLGRLLSRNIAMPFDAYLKALNSEKPTFSKTV